MAFKPVRVVKISFNFTLNSFLIDNIFMRIPRLYVRRIMHFGLSRKKKKMDPADPCNLRV